jgi:predicted ATPase
MLLERGAELDGLRDALGRARGRAGTIVLVSGEAGIGKTSLVRAFTAEVSGAARVLAGACEDLLAPRTLGPFRDMVQAGALPAPVPSGRSERDDYLDLLLGELSFALRPAVVVVDDAHWADDASLDILRYLGRRVEPLPALLVVTYRPGELGDGHPLRRVLGSFDGPAVLRLELAGLSDAAVTDLAVRAGVDPERLVAAAGGNPFYVTEALAAPGEQVPATVRDVVLGRVNRLPEPARRALDVVSVVPTEIDTGLLAVLVPGGPAALVPAERAGIVETTSDRVRFRHELARQAVEGALPGGRRAEVNAAVLAVLESARCGPWPCWSRWVRPPTSRTRTGSWAAWTRSRPSARRPRGGAAGRWPAPGPPAGRTSRRTRWSTSASPGSAWATRPASRTCGPRSGWPARWTTATTCAGPRRTWPLR